MSEPFIAEIRIVGFNFAPRNWALCDGQLLPINQNQSLYSLLGTTFGGDGRTTFALPDLRGRVPIHTGRSNGGPHHPLGQKSGEENVILSAQNVRHSHSLRASTSAADKIKANDNMPAVPHDAVYGPAQNTVPLADAALAPAGNTSPQSHNNMMPFMTLNFIISLRGLFPSHN